MVKHGIGWGAMTGIMSAELARHGFTGIPSILGSEKYREWVATLGSQYIMVDGIRFKRWSCCGWSHAALLAALQVVEENDIQVEAIAHITVYTYHQGWRLWQRHPRSTEEAQFSIKWPLATLLLDREVGPDQVLESRLDDEAVKALVDKIEILEDPEIDRWYQFVHNGVDKPDALVTSRVAITLVDGRMLDSGIVDRAAIEWDDAALEEKFRWITGYVLDDERIERLVTMVWEFENLSSVKELTQVLR
jgi:2-methylcitrate dehydratase PrpD